jgi:flagellar protein FlaJ
MTEESYSASDEEVNKIVETMKNKYREEGILIDEASSSLKELRGIIAEETYSKIDIESQDDLEAFGSDTTRAFGNIYLRLKGILKPLQNIIKTFPLTDELGFYLYSANMHYSANQYLALASAVGFVVALAMLAAGFIIGAVTRNLLFMTVLPLGLGFAGFLAATFLVLYIPRQKAVARGNACSIELPFALRHMSTELRAGIGLYKTLQAITSTNYGVLSEEFARTISEIEEGTDTSVALKHLALRTQSKPLKTTVNHIVRAMRVGGNLSDIMSDIAKDVSEDMKNKINTFAQKMNFFAVLFIFMGIVLPVAITILGAIRNSPLAATGQQLFKAVPLTPEIMMIFYFIAMPAMFGFMNLIVYMAQPKM